MASARLNITEAAQLMRQGGVIAYPTEAVFGLGCDPLNEKAVMQLLEVKSRPVSAGLILIASDYSQLSPWIDDAIPVLEEEVLASWPGPHTWLFPKSDKVPGWISGQHDSIALRVTNHPGCRELCDAFGGAIVSTSANRRGDEPGRSADEVEASLGDAIAGIVEGDVGSQQNPSQIRDARTGKTLRAG